jgi:hypothetical protein
MDVRLVQLPESKGGTIVKNRRVDSVKKSMFHWITTISQKYHRAKMGLILVFILVYLKPSNPFQLD